MPEDFLADVQYNDLQGTVAADGHEGPPLHQFAKKTDMPDGYIPVGLSFFGPYAYAENGIIDFTLVAVRQGEVGQSLKEWTEYERKHGKLPVYQFEGKIALNELPSLFKRLSIKMLLQHVNPLNVEVQYALV